MTSPGPPLKLSWLTRSQRRAQVGGDQLGGVGGQAGFQAVARQPGHGRGPGPTQLRRGQDNLRGKVRSQYLAVHFQAGTGEPERRDQPGRKVNHRQPQWPLQYLRLILRDRNRPQKTSPRLASMTTPMGSG